MERASQLLPEEAEAEIEVARASSAIAYAGAYFLIC